jgi:peptide chain release factor subunit 1
MELIEKVDMVNELSDLAEKTSANVVLVSRSSEEGDSLYRAFNGIAGLLRYAVDL